MKKILLTMLGVCITSAAVADGRQLTIVNANPEHYMLVNFVMCDNSEPDIKSCKTIEYKIDSQTSGKNWVDIDEASIPHGAYILNIQNAAVKGRGGETLAQSEFIPLQDRPRSIGCSFTIHRSIIVLNNYGTPRISCSATSPGIL